MNPYVEGYAATLNDVRYPPSHFIRIYNESRDYMSINTTKQKVLANPLLEARTNWRELWHMVVVLFKLRIVALLLLAAVGGAFLGAGGWPGLGPLLLILVTGGMAAAGASALNQFIERHRDEVMSRTRQRPLPAGQIAHPNRVVVISLLLILVPSLAVLPFKPALSFFLLLGAFIYVGIYTLWLKPRTLLNIVIGGAAGSAAVMSGGAALDAWRDPAVITLALLVFLWTPSHFWSLAILYKNDYERADVPMLPVHISLRQAGWWVFLHTGATGIAALFLAFSPELGWLYAVPVILATVDLFARNVRLISEPTPLHARSLFVASNIYLTVVLVALMASSVLHNFWAVL